MDILKKWEMVGEEAMEVGWGMWKKNEDVQKMLNYAWFFNLETFNTFLNKREFQYVNLKAEEKRDKLIFFCVEVT